MREIASLQTLCLRTIGAPACDPEQVLSGKPKKPKLLRRASSVLTTSGEKSQEEDEADVTPCPPPPDVPTLVSRLLHRMRDLDVPLRAYKSPRGNNANDVDINHPWNLKIYPQREAENNAPILIPEKRDGESAIVEEPTEYLVLEGQNPAVECMQMFIDAVVESGRAGDKRMGVLFWRELYRAVTGQDAPVAVVETSEMAGLKRPKKKQKKDKVKKAAAVSTPDFPLGSLSLHNFAAASTHTFRSMQYAGLGQCLGTLDLTGTHSLTDDILTDIICSSFPLLRRLSLKNCRKLTGDGIASLVKLKDLQSIDVGGCFNIHPNTIVDLVKRHPATKTQKLTEIYAGGLGWTDMSLEELADATSTHLKGLGIGFSQYVSGPGLILALAKLEENLDRLAIPFCHTDDEVMSVLGKKLTNLAALDIRGCGNISSLTGFMTGRTTSGYEYGHLFVLARYSGISNHSLKETKKVFSEDLLTCVGVGGVGTGIGGGIRR